MVSVPDDAITRKTKYLDLEDEDPEVLRRKLMKLIKEVKRLKSEVEH